MSTIRLIRHEAVPKCGSYEVRFSDGTQMGPAQSASSPIKGVPVEPALTIPKRDVTRCPWPALFAARAHT